MRIFSKRLFNFIAILALTFGVLSLLESELAFAGTVGKVTGKRAIINLQGLSVNNGDQLFATANGKKKAILQVIKVSGGRALVSIRKGTAKTGMRVIARSTLARGSGASKKAAPEDDSDADMSQAAEDVTSTNKTSSFAMGAIFGYSINSMKVNLEYNEDGDVETVEMAGSGISAKILADFNFNPYFGVRATSGLEQFNVYGEGEEEVCDDQSDTKCSTEISFLTLDAVLRFIFVPGTFAPWAGAGFTLLFPSGSSTTALDEASITTTWAGLISLGFDLSLGKMAYVPFQFDYALFNNSENVATDLMALRLGVGFKF